tara:strand:- start:241 stop:507 length:267 start_codon:yes stop_codon:yes gene_type:complete
MMVGQSNKIMNTEDNPLFALIVGLGIMAVLLLSCAYMFAPEVEAPTETKQKARHITLEGSSFHVEVIDIDGVEYVVAKTYHGVGVCKK